MDRTHRSRYVPLVAWFSSALRWVLDQFTYSGHARYLYRRDFTAVHNVPLLFVLYTGRRGSISSMVGFDYHSLARCARNLRVVDSRSLLSSFDLHFSCPRCSLVALSSRSEEYTSELPSPSF